MLLKSKRQVKNALDHLAKPLETHLSLNQRFLNNELIGNGTYGDVFKAYDVKLGQIVAVKKMKSPE